MIDLRSIEVCQRQTILAMPFVKRHDKRIDVVSTAFVLAEDLGKIEMIIISLYRENRSDGKRYILVWCYDACS